MSGSQPVLPQDSLGSAKNATHSTGLTVAACLGVKTATFLGVTV